MNIRIKTILITAVAITLMVIAEVLVSNLIFIKQFDKFDQDQVQSDIRLILSRLGNNYEEMTRLLWDRASSDETITFMQGANQDYWSLDWTRSSFQQLNVDAVIFLDQRGDITESGFFDPELPELKKLPSGILDLFSRGAELNKFVMEGKRLHGVAVIQDGILFLSSAQIPPSSIGPSAYGHLIFGRMIDNDLLRAFDTEIGAELEIYPIEQAPLDFQSIQASLPPGTRSQIQVLGDNSIAGYLILMDPQGEPAILLRFLKERQFFQEGLRGLNFAVTSTITVGIILMLIYLAALEGYVLGPLSRLRAELISAEKEQAYKNLGKSIWQDDIPNLREPIEHAIVKAQDAEAKGQRAKALYSGLISQANDGFALFDYDSLLMLDANPAYFRMTGFQDEPGKHPTLYALLQKTGHKLNKEKIRELIDHTPQGKPFDFEYSPAFNGSQQVIEITGSMIDTGEGRNVYVLLRDITQRKKLEKELQQRLKESLILNRVIAAASSTFENEEVLQMICKELASALDIHQVGIGLINEESQIVRVVAEYCAPGVPPSKGIEFSLNFDPSIKKFFELNKPVFILDAQNDPLTAAIYKLLADRKTVSAMAFPLKIQNHTVGALTLESLQQKIFTSREKSLAENVSMAISRSLELNHLYGNLQKELEYRKETEIELKAARDTALEGSREKSKFMATMSHEIRTPLNAVIGMLELLQDTPLNHEQREYSYIAQDSAQILLALMNDILEFSKIEAGKISLDSIAFDLVEAIESAVDPFVVRAKQKGLDVFIHISPRIPRMVMGDPIRLKQILMNLISNAVKFTDAGEIFINVEKRSKKKKRIEIIFSIKDTGIGITKKAQKQLFKPFIQVDGGNNRKYGGTGLGLEISRRLVELMGGRIGIESQPGRGSDFHFTIFLEETNIEKLKGEREPWDNLAGRTILVLTESEKQKAILRSYLGAKRIRTRFAATIDQLRKIILDPQFPKQEAIYLFDGSFSNRVGVNEARSLFMETGIKPEMTISLIPLNRRELVGAANSLGIGAVLFRPIRMNTLYTTLSNLLEGKKAVLDVKFQRTSRETQPSGMTAENQKRAGAWPMILLVEDNDANIMVASAQIQKLGCEVEISREGGTAVDLFRRNPMRYQLILMDCQMPGIDGYIATQMIREMESKTGIRVPIIAMTAHVSLEDRKECLDAGMDDYIGKPVRMGDLRQVLAKWLPIQVTDEMAPADEGSKDESPPLLDRQVLISLGSLIREGEEGFSKELFRTFLKQSKLDIRQLEEGIISLEMENVRKAAHALKGSSSTIGAARFAEICSRIERMAAAGQAPEIIEILDKFRMEFNELKRALSEEMKASDES